jgi:large subunit ribosomal protein L29
MAKTQLRDLTLDDLKVKLADMSEEIFKLRFRLTTQPLDNPLRIRAVRRDIARVKTFIRQRELGVVASAAPAKTPRAKAATAAAPKRASRKAAAKKTGAKKTSAKKTAAKKAPARKRRET